MTTSQRVCASLFCALGMASIIAFAQAPVGAISGTVRDESGAVMPGVTVTITNKNTGLSRQVLTWEAGTFGAPSLLVGRYTIRAEAKGFRSVVREATVATGATTTVDLAMQVGAPAEVVNVEEAATQITYDTHTIEGVITRERIENLPLNGRSFLQLAMLEPGVTVCACSMGQYNRQFDVNILGADSGDGAVRITVDGTTVNDSVTGGTQQNFSQEVVQEFQVSSVNFDLSTGIAAGGAVNIVTRSGGNDFHGSGFFFFRDHNMAAYPYLERDPRQPDPFFARRQSGYYLGGPIKKDKLFFFSSLEHTNQTGVFSAFPTDPYFAQFAVNASSPYHGNELTERLDYRINQKHSAFLRYSHDGNNGYAPPGGGALPSDWVVNTNFADSGVFSLISALKPSLVNEFRYSMTYWSNTNNTPTAAQCPAPCIGLGLPNLSIYGVGNFTIGNATNAPQSRVLRRHIFHDNMTLQKSSHALKFGGYWEYERGTGTYAYAEPAAGVLYSPEIVQYFNSQVPPPFQIQIPSSFNTINDILQLPVAGFATGVGDINQPPLWHRGAADHNSSLHFYWQDTWRIRPRFTLNYGLGYSYQTNQLNHDLTKPDYLAPIFGANGLGHEEHSPRNFSPMLGFAWTVTKDSKTVVRGGAGMYYDSYNTEVRLIERAMLGPRGTGRALLGDSVFFPAIAQALDFAALPPPLQPSSLSTQPTTFTGAVMLQLLPALRAGAQQELGPPGNNDLTIRNIQVFKTGTELLAQNFRLPYAEHFAIGIQREVRPDLVVSADFVDRQYLHQRIRDTDLNHFYSKNGPVIPACQGTQALDPTVECSTGVIEGILSGARSHYRGLLVKADKRFAHRTSFTVSYAYASRVGFNGLIDNSNWFASWGPQQGHQNLTASAVVDLPWGFQVSGITAFGSKGPFQPFIPGIDLNGNGITSGESSLPSLGVPIPGGGYNEFNLSKGKSDLANLVNQFNQTYAGKTTPLGQTIPSITLPANYSLGRSFNSQDLRLTKTFKLHSERYKVLAFGEVFNIFNIANLGGYGTSLTDPGFGVPTTRTSNIFGSGGPRAFQLGARFSF